MPTYRLNSFAGFVENYLFPAVVQYAVFNLLTGNLVQVCEQTSRALRSLGTGRTLELTAADLQLGTQYELPHLLAAEVLLPEARGPLSSYLCYRLVRPVQNPAITFKTPSSELRVVRVSMHQRLYSPAVGHEPEVIEESVPAASAQLLAVAGTDETLVDVKRRLAWTDEELMEALKWLVLPERQLVKLAPLEADVSVAFLPFNTVPRTLSVASSETDVSHFHQTRIEDPDWEFDWVEPTVNHSFRFPSAALGGLTYGARFFEALSNRLQNSTVEMLEVGGGTGSFGRAFLERASGSSQTKLRYHLLDLSPTLFQRQQQTIGEYLAPERHYLQNATTMSLPEVQFDLIVSNEVIGDFPVAPVVRNAADNSWGGEGAAYVQRYTLSVDADSFWVNAGVFNFLERAWEQLKPGGTMVLTEYGGENKFPVQSFHLNHPEFSIHFGHLLQAATQIGFECELQPLKTFMSLDDEVEYLAGQEEQILCLNHVLSKFGEKVPYAAISRAQFLRQYGSVAEQIDLDGVSFLPLNRDFHFGPTLDQFMVATLTKPSHP